MILRRLLLVYFVTYLLTYLRFREVSALSDSDSDVTVQDDDDDVQAGDDEEAELITGDGPLRSREGQGEGRVKVIEASVPRRRATGPWFVRPPCNVTVAMGRTLNCECIVDGQQPIGRSTNYREL